MHLQWKPKAESGKWLGADGHVHSPGFVLLKGRPKGIPAVVQPAKNIMHRKHYKELLGGKMTRCIEAEGEPEAKEWLKKAAKHGVIPVHRRLQAVGEITPGELGSEVELKCGRVTAKVQMIEDFDQTAEEFWALPAELQAALDEERLALQALSEKHKRQPAVGYKRVPTRKRPTYEGSAAQHYNEEQEQQLLPVRTIPPARTHMTTATPEMKWLLQTKHAPGTMIGKRKKMFQLHPRRHKKQRTRC